MAVIRNDILAFKTIFACLLGNDPKSSLSITEITACYAHYIDQTGQLEVPTNYIGHMFETFLVSYYSNQDPQSFNRKSSKSNRYGNLGFISPALNNLCSYIIENVKKSSVPEIQGHTQYLFWKSQKDVISILMRTNPFLLAAFSELFIENRVFVDLDWLNKNINDYEKTMEAQGITQPRVEQVANARVRKAYRVVELTIDDDDGEIEDLLASSSDVQSSSGRGFGSPKVKDVEDTSLSSSGRSLAIPPSAEPGSENNKNAELMQRNYLESNDISSSQKQLFQNLLDNSKSVAANQLVIAGTLKNISENTTEIGVSTEMIANAINETNIASKKEAEKAENQKTWDDDNYDPNSIATTAEIVTDYEVLGETLEYGFTQRNTKYPHLATTDNAVYNFITDVLENKKQELYQEAMRRLAKSMLGASKSDPAKKNK